MLLREIEAREAIARESACRIIERFGIVHPQEINLERIAWKHGVAVRYAQLKGAEARLIRLGQRGIITARPFEDSPARSRFAIAHELGHWILHGDRDQWWLSSAESIHGYAGSNEELEANAFASELLLPASLFAKHCSQAFGFSIVKRLGDLFQTSLTATALKYIEHCGEKCCVILSDGEEVRWSWRSRALPDFAYHVPKGFTLSDDSKAWSAVIDEENGMSTVPWRAWFPGLDPRRDYEVWEESHYQENYGTVLTFLSINEY